MSLIPAFQIGLWNAWILMALNFSTSMLASLINKEGVARAMGIGVIDEERFLLEKYGDVYQQYLKRTPRWIGIPKSGKKR